MAGLPGINMNQDSPDYKYTHHSAADALEAVNRGCAGQHVSRSENGCGLGDAGAVVAVCI